MSIDPINEAFIAASSLQASDDIHKSFRETFDLSQCTKVIPDTLSLLVRSLSDEVEARFERSFAQRDAELLRLRADVIKLKDEAALTLAIAKKCLDEDYVSRRLKQFLDSKEFEEAVGEQVEDAMLRSEFGGRAIAEINDLITQQLRNIQVTDPDLTAKIRTTMCDILRHTAFVVPTS